MAAAHAKTTFLAESVGFQERLCMGSQTVEQRS